MAKTVRIAKGTTLPSVTDAIEDNGTPVDLSSADVFFRMRAEDGESLLLDGAATVTDAYAGLVEFEWTPGDTDVAGNFKGWWSVQQGSLIQDSPEFDVIVFEHSPGGVTSVGAIARRVRAYIPETISAMLEDGKFSYADFQMHIDDAKWKLFGSSCAPSEEENFYSIPVIGHVAKLVTIRIIPAGVDFWNNRIISEAITGTNEQIAYNDRRKGLWDIRAALLVEVAKAGVAIDEDGVAILTRRPSRSTPRLSTAQTNAITPDPIDIGPVFGPRGLPHSRSLSSP